MAAFAFSTCRKMYGSYCSHENWFRPKIWEQWARLQPFWNGVPTILKLSTFHVLQIVQNLMLTMRTVAVFFNFNTREFNIHKEALDIVPWYDGLTELCAAYPKREQDKAKYFKTCEQRGRTSKIYLSTLYQDLSRNLRYSFDISLSIRTKLFQWLAIQNRPTFLF